MDDLLLGFQTAFSLTNLFYCLLGVTLGTLIGVLPGIGAVAAVSILLPISFYLEPTTALIMLGGVYYGAEYGGSTASIMLNLPGSPSNAVTCLDGYPMAKQGRAGVALFITTVASFAGGTMGILSLMALTPAVVAISLSFRSAEYFSVMLLGLIAAATVSQSSPIKGLAMVVLGLLVGCIGLDVASSTIRFDLGLAGLSEGLSIIVIAMGLFGVSEVIASIRSTQNNPVTEQIGMRGMIPTRQDVRDSAAPVLRGGLIGCFFGAMPGTGPSIAAFFSYFMEKRVARDPSIFGKGAVQGIAAPESANNAAVQTAFIPMLAMGIPGSATTAIMMGALMIHGITPGPLLMSDHPDLFWGVIASFWIGNVILLILNIPLIGVWVAILRVPYRLLYPGIICLICIGVYSINNNIFDVWLVLVVGIIGYFMRLYDFQPAPLLLAFILGPLMEENFRRAMLLARGDFLVILQRPISGSMLALAFAILVYIFWSRLNKMRREKPEESSA